MNSKTYSVAENLSAEENLYLLIGATRLRL